MLIQKINDDLKAAMLARDPASVETLRGLKSVILYAEVAAGKREIGLSDDEIIGLFAREAKKRQESADLYVQGGAQERADKELTEKQLIESYLPTQLADDELTELVDAAIASTGAVNAKDIGRVISSVKAQAGASADGAKIAQLVKARLNGA